MEKHNNRIFYQSLLSIVIPIALQNLFASLLNMTDVFMISSLSTAAIGGVGMANKVFFLLNLFLFGTISGASILASQYFGNNDIPNIKRVLGATLMIGVIGSFVFALGAIFFPEVILKVMAPDEELMILEGAKYLRLIGYSYVFTAITFTYSFLLRSTRNTVLPMLISVSAIGINTFLNWALIFGHFGVKAMGVEGAAYATIFARAIECFTLLFFVYFLKLPLAAKLREIFSLSKAFVKHYMKTVIFVIMNEVIWSIGVVIYSLAYGRMGEVASASIIITQSIEQLAFVVLFGLCNASGVMLGNALGANQLDLVEEYAKRFLKIIFFSAVGISIMIMACSRPIASLFNVSEIVQDNIVYCLIAFCIYLPIKAINMVMIVGILRSGGDTVASLLIDLAGVYLVGIPMAFIGALVFKLEIPFVYALVMLEEPAKFILCVSRYSTKKWIKNIVVDTPI